MNTSHNHLHEPCSQESSFLKARAYLSDLSKPEKEVLMTNLGVGAGKICVENFPDEEDLTTEMRGSRNVLKFKDKIFDPIKCSGMGKVFLRKNIVKDVNNCGKLINILTQDMFEDEHGLPLINTIFIIQYDYDLDKGFITIPENSVLVFAGGSFRNGTVILKNTLMLPAGLDIEHFMSVNIRGNYKEGSLVYLRKHLRLFNGQNWVNIGGPADFTPQDKLEIINVLKKYINATLDIVSPFKITITPEKNYIETGEHDIKVSWDYNRLINNQDIRLESGNKYAIYKELNKCVREYTFEGIDTEEPVTIVISTTYKGETVSEAITLTFNQNPGLVIDDEINEESTNPVENQAITKVIKNTQLEIQSILTDLGLYLTKEEAANTYLTQEDINDYATKQWVEDKQHQSLENYVKKSELASVATSGSYNDLTNKPTNVSAFNNDAGYITNRDIPDIPSIQGLATKEYVDNTVSGKQDKLPSGSDGQVLKWSNNAWRPGRDETGEGGEGPSMEEIDARIKSKLGLTHPSDKINLTYDGSSIAEVDDNTGSSESSVDGLSISFEEDKLKLKNNGSTLSSSDFDVYSRQTSGVNIADVTFGNETVKLYAPIPGEAIPGEKGDKGDQGPAGDTIQLGFDNDTLSIDVKKLGNSYVVDNTFVVVDTAKPYIYVNGIKQKITNLQLDENIVGVKVLSSNSEYMLAVNYDDSGSVNNINTRLNKSCTATVEGGKTYTFYFGVIYSEYGEYDLLITPKLIMDSGNVSVKVRKEYKLLSSKPEGFIIKYFTESNPTERTLTTYGDNALSINENTTFKLYKEPDTLVDQETVEFYTSAEASQGLQGAILRNRGKWSDTISNYVNESTKTNVSSTELRYIDYVVYNETYYMVKQGISNYTVPTGIVPTNTTYWVEAEAFDFAAFKALIAENAQIKYLDGKEVRIWDNIDSSNKTLVAGLTSGGLEYKSDGSGDTIIPTSGNPSGDNAVRIWAGNTGSAGNYDLTTAPFRVTQKGEMWATNAHITGDVTATSFNVVDSSDHNKVMMEMTTWGNVSDEIDTTKIDSDTLNKLTSNTPVIVVTDENGNQYILNMLAFGSSSGHLPVRYFYNIRKVNRVVTTNKNFVTQYDASTDTYYDQNGQYPLNNVTVYELVKSGDIIFGGDPIYAVLPGNIYQGINFVNGKKQSTGRRYLIAKKCSISINSGGNSWHISAGDLVDYVYNTTKEVSLADSFNNYAFTTSSTKDVVIGQGCIGTESRKILDNQFPATIKLVKVNTESDDALSSLDQGVTSISVGQYGGTFITI